MDELIPKKVWNTSRINLLGSRCTSGVKFPFRIPNKKIMMVDAFKFFDVKRIVISSTNCRNASPVVVAFTVSFTVNRNRVAHTIDVRERKIIMMQLYNFE